MVHRAYTPILRVITVTNYFIMSWILAAMTSAIYETTLRLNTTNYISPIIVVLITEYIFGNLKREYRIKK